MNYKILMGILLPSVLFSVCVANNEKQPVSGKSPQLSVKTPPLRPEEAFGGDISEISLAPVEDSGFHGFSPKPPRERVTSDGSATVLAGLVSRRSTFGSTGSLHDHPFSPCKRSILNACGSFGSICDSLSSHLGTPTK